MAEFRSNPTSESGEIIGEVTFDGKFKPGTHQGFLLQIAEDRVLTKVRSFSELEIGGSRKPTLAPGTTPTVGPEGIGDAIIQVPASKRTGAPKFALKQKGSVARGRVFFPTNPDVQFAGKVLTRAVQIRLQERENRQKRIINPLIKGWHMETDGMNPPPPFDEWIASKGYLYDEEFARIYKLKGNEQ